MNTKQALKILSSSKVELLDLLNQAYQLRKKYFGKEVLVHVINNAQNGYCPEDCHYCAQSKSSKAKIEVYPLKSDLEILKEAKAAYLAGAHRYCLVFAGQTQSLSRIEHLAKLIREIKRKYPLEVCVSPGTLDRQKANILKQAGLNRLNHNLNTSARHYSKICSTHTFTDRLQTIQTAKSIGLKVCSGIIVGMGESAKDLVDLALKFQELKIDSIPVNFFIPIPGVALKPSAKLTPEYCLRVLCVFRLLNPKAEIRIAAGRELYFGRMEALALFPANSLFLEGYLNAKGSSNYRTLKMIQDAGFRVKSDQKLEKLLKNIRGHADNLNLKSLKELRPYQ